MGRTKLSKRGVNLKRLTDKQLKFVTEYPKDFNGKRAVIAAGYSKNAAGVMANKLLNHPLVQKALGKAMLHTVETAELTREQIVAEVDAAAMFDPINLCGDERGIMSVANLHKVPAYIRRWMTVKQVLDKDGNVRQLISLSASDKRAIVELAMKHRGMLVEKVELTPKLPAVDWDTIYESHEGEAGSVEELLRIEEDKGS